MFYVHLKTFCVLQEIDAPICMTDSRYRKMKLPIITIILHIVMYLVGIKLHRSLLFSKASNLNNYVLIYHVSIIMIMSGLVSKFILSAA